MQGKKFQCVGSTLTPKFWHRYDKYNDDSNSKASPYLIVKLIFVIVNLNLSIFVLVNVPSVVLHNLNVAHSSFFCHAQAKRFCQLCTVLGNILHSTHCQQICTIMNNIAFICTTLHIILTPQECCTLYIFALECSRCSVLHNIVSIQSFTHWPETEWYHPKLESDLQKQVLL